MRKYLEIARISFKTQLAYRFDVAMSMAVTVSRILFACVLWGAVFGKRETVAGFTLAEMLSYYVISAFLSQIEMSGGVSGEISERVRGGTFSKYMVTPVNTRGYFLAQTFGAAGYYLIFDFLAALAWALLFGIKPAITTNPAMLLAAALMVAMGLTFMIQLNYALGLMSFRFLNISAFLMIKDNAVQFLTGALVPLALLPEALAGAMRLFPFYYVTYLPSMLILGKNGGEAPLGLAVLFIWLLAVSLFNRYYYDRARVVYDGVGI